MARVFLLAYPRSGSSIARLLIAYLLRRNPCQPGGQVEAPMAKLLEDVKLYGSFYKYHTAPKDGPFQLNMNGGDVLIHLVRDPLENLISWLYSQQYPKGKPVDENEKGKVAAWFIKQPHAQLVKHISNHRKNQQFFDDRGDPKVQISYESMLDDPEYLIEKIGSVLEVTPKGAEEFRAHFDTLKDNMMVTKSSPDDSIRLNTFGDVNHWKNLLEEEDIKLFRELYKGQNH